MKRRRFGFLLQPIEGFQFGSLLELGTDFCLNPSVVFVEPFDLLFGKLFKIYELQFEGEQSNLLESEVRRGRFVLDRTFRNHFHHVPQSDSVLSQLVKPGC